MTQSNQGEARPLVGQGVLRREDEHLLRGAGRYLDDLPEPRDVIHVGFVMSAYAHARILSVDSAAARALPGVIEVLSGADFVSLVRPFGPAIETAWCHEARRPAVGVGTVRLRGETRAGVLAAGGPPAGRHRARRICAALKRRCDRTYHRGPRTEVGCLQSLPRQQPFQSQTTPHTETSDPFWGSAEQRS